MRLLIINDEIRTAETLQQELHWEVCGIEKVFTAFSAHSARKMIEEEKPDILLCDIEMPEENGIQLMQWVREKELPVECIFLTCHANFVYAQEAVRLNCQDYVLMPARSEEIEEAVKKVVERLIRTRKKEELESLGQVFLEKTSEKAREVQGDHRNTEDLIRECQQYILDHLEDKELSVAEMAEHFHLNSIYLNRIFKKSVGMSISQKIIKEKMSMAARLLEKKELTAATVAEMVGYPNYSYFSTAFKKYYGMSPQQYKDSL